MPRRVGQKQPQYRKTFLKEWRQHRNLTLERACERVAEMLPGFAPSALSRMENGRAAYTQPVLEALAVAYGCEPQDLIMRKPDSEVWSLVDTLEAMPPEDRQTVARIVAGLRRTG